MLTILKVVTLGLVSLLAISGCSSSTATDSNNSNVVDIKDIVLTNKSGDCADYSASYQAEVKDIQLSEDYIAQFNVSDDETKCSVTANDIPNYDFNDDSAHWATPIAEQNISVSIPRNPKAAATTSDLSLLTYNAIMLNGVVLDQVANGCYKPDDSTADQDGNVANGCGLWVDWRLDPMGKVSLGTDSHNGHTQPDGLYHYHGNPLALFDTQDSETVSPVIGFAADGFPIYGPHFLDPSTGKVTEAKSGYTVKSGDRSTSDASPGGAYDGTYIQDYEFTNAGHLDKCNGMTVNGQYGYYVTSSYPYVMGCFTGSPDWSFSKFKDIVVWASCGFLAVVAGVSVLIIRRRRKRR
jgi:hypothetical protein